MSSDQKFNEIKQSRSIRLQGISKGKVLAGPQTIHIDIANGCNTNCTTCWDHSPLLNSPPPSSWKRKQMDLANFVLLVDDIASMNSVEAVILSGMGDPFVNSNIYKMIEICKEKHWQVTTLTNALLADSEKILTLDLDMMLISVNGVSAKSYMEFHPNLREKDFERLCKLLATFAEAGKQFKHIQVINKSTAPELVEMIRFGANYKVAHITYKLASLHSGTEQCAITELQRERLLNEWIPEAREESFKLNVKTNLDVFENQLRAGGLATAPVSDIGCFMGWFYSRITVEGKILFCCSTEVEIGSLEQGKFSEQWYGSQWNQVRERLMSGIYYPSCSQCGKLNQNVKIGKKIEERFGPELYLKRTGR